MYYPTKQTNSNPSKQLESNANTAPEGVPEGLPNNTPVFSAGVSWPFVQVELWDH